MNDPTNKVNPHQPIADKYEFFHDVKYRVCRKLDGMYICNIRPDVEPPCRNPCLYQMNRYEVTHSHKPKDKV